MALPASRQTSRRGRRQGQVEAIYGNETTLDPVGVQTPYVEPANLTSRQMNGRLVHKTLSLSKALEMLKASSFWEEAVYNLTREVKTLRVRDDRFIASSFLTASVSCSNQGNHFLAETAFAPTSVIEAGCSLGLQSHHPIYYLFFLLLREHWE